MPPLASVARARTDRGCGALLQARQAGTSAAAQPAHGAPAASTALAAPGRRRNRPQRAHRGRRTGWRRARLCAAARACACADNPTLPCPAPAPAAREARACTSCASPRRNSAMMRAHSAMPPRSPPAAAASKRTTTRCSSSARYASICDTACSIVPCARRARAASGRSPPALPRSAHPAPHARRASARAQRRRRGRAHGGRAGAGRGAGLRCRDRGGAWQRRAALSLRPGFPDMRHRVCAQAGGHKARAMSAGRGSPTVPGTLARPARPCPAARRRRPRQTRTG
jgi:hypothetical protein